ncbi:NACHT domain-containing protein [Streptomyces hawaiiensis]|uniref:NACHT domain-containing protein n=1 Tax=Streptomyces hawaiiensis TaxID=67305 RepID=UPI0036687FAF
MDEPSGAAANTEFRRLLAEAKAAAGMTQSQLAKAAGVSNATVSNALNRPSGVPSADTLDRLAAALRISGDALAGLHRLRQQADRRSRHLDDYVNAARRAAREHPYPGVLPGMMPPLASVYLRQWVDARRDQAEGPSRLLPADRVLMDGQMCVVLAGPGGGKSSLLRARLATGIQHWQEGVGEATVPVLVQAAALAGRRPLADALASAVTAELSTYGLAQALPTDFFANAPYRDVPWLVLVDGLDEVTDPAARRAVVSTIMEVRDDEKASRYRFAVATRPLPSGELDALDRAAGSEAGGSGSAERVPRYTLQPFTADDLPRIARSWFEAFQLPEVDRVVTRFLESLEGTRLTDLARTPLMASMLCQLHATHPDSPLPTSRGGVYRAFTDLLHERQHAGSGGVRTQTRHLFDRYGSTALASAEAVLDRMPALIAQHAARGLVGHWSDPVAAIASDPAVRPAPHVSADVWRAFIEAGLRRSGLMTTRAGRLDFLHRTMLEYLAARHATRTPEAASRSLRTLFRPRRGLLPGWVSRYQVPRQVDVSYVGFLLDVSPAASSGTIASILARLASRSGMDGCALIADLALLSTSLPEQAVAIATRRFRSVAEDPAASPSGRVTSAEALISLVGTQGTDLLHRLASDSALQSGARTYAAQALVDRGDDRCTALLEALGTDRSLDPQARVWAAEKLLTADRTRGTALLDHLGRDTHLPGKTRTWAAQKLCGHDESGGIGLLRLLALDPTLDQAHRLQAATVLLETAGPDVADPLEALARDVRLDHAHRVRAAHACVRVLGSGAVELLGALALDTTLVGYDRVWAAGTLAALDAEKGSPVLEALGQDGALHEDDRRWVRDSLARLDAEPAATGGLTEQERESPHAGGGLAPLPQDP